MADILKSVPIELDQNVLVGLETSDDAGVFKLSDDLALVQTVDFITPIADDPRVFGQVAAANALSDVYAMGGRPITALNLCCFPGSGIENSVLEEILRGGLEKIREAGAVLLGGHTVKDDELKYGLAVTGIVHPARFVTNKGAQPGDSIVLTKPIGSGVIIGGVRSGQLPEEVLERVIRDMVTLNKAACDAMLQFETHACTDVTGFGLAGHAMGIARASKVGVRLFAGQVPHYPEAKELIRNGASTRMTPLNQTLVAKGYSREAGVTSEEEGLCFDPQTSGGLLIFLPSAVAESLVEILFQHGLEKAAIVGEVFPSLEPRLELVRRA